MQAKLTRSHTAISKISSNGRRQLAGTPAKHNPKTARPKRKVANVHIFRYLQTKDPSRLVENDLKRALEASLEDRPSDEASSSSSSSSSSSCSSRSSRASSASTSSTSSYMTSRSTSSQDNSYVKDETTQPLLFSQTEASDTYNHKPGTEDFLSFICFKSNPNESSTSSNISATTGKIIQNNVSKKNSTASNSSCTSNTSGYSSASNSSNTNIGNTTTTTTNNNDKLCQINRRRPLRQSPRLATRHSTRQPMSDKSKRRISESDSSSYYMNGHSSSSMTAHDSSLDYEENLRRASIALEDMAQEINCANDKNNVSTRNSLRSDGSDSKMSSSYKNNRHLVKSLLTREFAGAFADEETIFEMISKYKF